MSDLLFESNQFNLSQVHPHFINPCCFGEDLAAWLSEQLRAQDFSATSPAQEDWGWYFDVQMNGADYFVGVGGNSHEDAADPNFGEWRIMVEKTRSLWQKLRGKNQASRAEPIYAVIENLLRQKLGIASVRYE